jgi:hypothetical protein
MRDPKKERMMTPELYKRYLTLGIPLVCTVCRGPVLRGEVYLSKGNGNHKTKFFCSRHIEADSVAWVELLEL